MLGDHDLLPAPGSPQVIAQLVFQRLDTDFGHGTASLAEEVATRADRGSQRVQPVGVEPQKSRKPGLRATSGGRSGENLLAKPKRRSLAASTAQLTPYRSRNVWHVLPARPLPLRRMPCCL